MENMLPTHAGLDLIARLGLEQIILDTTDTLAEIAITLSKLDDQLAGYPIDRSDVDLETDYALLCDMVHTAAIRTAQLRQRVRANRPTAALRTTRMYGAGITIREEIDRQ